VNLFYVTPIIYPAKMVPEAWKFYFVESDDGDSRSLSRLSISGRSKALGEWVALVLSLLVFYSGLRIYRRLRPAFADVL